VAVDAMPAHSLVLLLCEYASIHSDGTMSMLRGGFEFWKVKATPAQLDCAVVLIIPAATLPQGEHEVAFRLTTASGAVTWTTLMTATVKNERYAIQGVLRLSATVDAFGPAVVEVSSGAAMGRVMIEVSQASE
jgi:hypothetical protein